MVSRTDIVTYAETTYHTKPEHLWANFPNHEVLRQTHNKKWYAMILNVPKSKVGVAGEDMMDILNVKCNPDMVALLHGQKGFAPAYHMNKTHWITILLDGSLSDDIIYNLIDASYEMTK